MESGQTGYARTSDGIHIAYRTWGEKSPLHVFLSEFGATVDTRDMHPSFLRLWRQLSGISQVVSLDRRGIGTSDGVCPHRFDLDEYVIDILAVVDTLGAEEVVLTGEGSAAAAAVAFTVAHPDRVTRLGIVNGAASAVRREGYDIAQFSQDEVIAMTDHFQQVWGRGELLSTFSPKLAFDPSFVEVCGRIERFVCGPNAAGAWGHALVDLDIRELATRVEVPTLVYFTGDLLHVTAEQCRDLADRIPHASFVEAHGRLFYQPDESPQLDEFAEFIGGRIEPDPTIEAALMFLDVVGSTDHAASMGDASWLQVLSDLDAFVQQQVSFRGGRVVKQTGDGHLAIFDDPSDAVSAALMITKGVDALGIEVRGGVHFGEVSLRPNDDVGGLAVHFTARLMNAAGARQVYVSQALAARVVSGSLRFEDRGERQFKGVRDHHRVLEALGN
jgi:class 3 adenylate cyclase/pimeloyl-ACP methyl ester carboxylesterase